MPVRTLAFVFLSIATASAFPLGAFSPLTASPLNCVPRGPLAYSSHTYRPSLGLRMSDFSTVPPAEAYEKMKGESYTYVDVRTPGEYASGSVPGSVLIPAFEKSLTGMSPAPEAFKQEFQKQFPDKSAKLLISCASGKRSTVACGWLTDLGYSDIVEVAGGFG
eukprot:CAMPEP_0174930432 /NCGR_PEP_ID=MMETSP1355-20121228/31160_1 /TAXON_ID=464990 /ORGANISM="Hemiselmis tepida, Strain CCMP443" /LENGTH=162 /DNA_ID=CAMNT_0016176725 /DNA_START=12 /DNA_END=496 /DNA_ORIENTATION=-